MAINRRQFFTFSAAGLGGAALFGARQAHAATTSGMPVLKAPEPPVELHIGCQQMLVPGKSFAERYDFL